MPEVEYVFPEELPAPAPGSLTTIQSRAVSVLSKARELTITSQDELTAADTFRKDIRALLKLIDETFDPQINQAKALHKSLLAKKKEFADPPEQGLAFVNTKIGEYLKEQDRLRFEKQRERELKEREINRLADKAVDQAHDLMDKDQAAKAKSVFQGAIAKVGKLESEIPEIPEKPQADVTLRTTWDFEVVDVEKIPRKYMVPDLVTIGKIVRALKEQTDIPGIRAFPKTTVADKGNR